MRLGVDRQKRDGYLNNYSGIGPRKLGNTDYIALRGSIVADLTPDLENYLVATYSHSDVVPGVAQVQECNPNFVNPADPTAAAFVALGCGSIARRNAASGGDRYAVMQPHANPFSKTTQWQVINTTTWNASDNLTIKNIASYGEFGQKVLTDFFGTDFYLPDFRPQLAPPVHFGFATIGGIDGGYLSRQYTFTEELQLQGRSFGNRLNWVAGFFTEHSSPIGKSGNSPPILVSCIDYATRNCTDPLSTALFGGAAAIGSMGQQRSEIRYINYAVFGQGTYAFSNQFKVTAGVRYTWDTNKNTTTQRLYNFRPFPTYGTLPQGGGLDYRCAALFADIAKGCTFTFPAARSDALTWVLDLVYQPTPDLMAYTKYGRGYRAAIVSPTNPVLALTQVAPEKVDFYEVGVKSTWDGAVRGTFNITGFYNDFTDQQIQLSFTPKPQFRGLPRSASAINAGSSEIYGIEVEGSLEPFDGFSLNGSYSWLKTKIKSVPDITALAAADPRYDIVIDFTPGDRLVLAPEHKLSLTATYQLPLDQSIGVVRLGATFSYTASMISNYKDRLSPSLNLRKYSNLPGYSLLNLNLNWNSVAGSPVDLSLFATNVTKKLYRVFTPGAGQSSPLEVAQLGEPRMYGLRLRYSFGP